MNTIKFVIVVSIVLVSAGLFTHLAIVAYGEDCRLTDPTMPAQCSDSDLIEVEKYGIETLEMIKQYCLDNVQTILAGGDPVQDLINAGLIPPLSIGSEK